MAVDEEAREDDENTEVMRHLAASIVKGIARDMVIRGEVDATKVSASELHSLAEQRLVELVHADEVEFAFVVDYTSNVLADARSHAKDGKDEYAFVFYTLYYEHILNRAIRDRAVKRGFSEKEGFDLMRRSMPEKLGLTWKLLFNEEFPETLRADLLATTRRRNSFIHYKWQTAPNMSETLEEEEARRSGALDVADRAAVQLTAHLNQVLVAPGGAIGKWLHSPEVTPGAEMERQ